MLCSLDLGLVQSRAGDDGDSSLVELVDLLARPGGKVHGEEQVLPGAVQIDGQNNLGGVRHCKYKGD